MKKRTFLIFFLFSLALHAALIIASEVPFGQWLEALERARQLAEAGNSKDRQVVLHIEKDDEGKDKTGKFLSQLDRRGLGQVTPLEGINRNGEQTEGDLNPTPPTPTPRPIPETATDPTGIEAPSPLKVAPLTFRPPVAIWTGEQAVLNLGELSTRFQVGSESYAFAEFFNQYFHSIQASLAAFLGASGMGLHLMKSDQVSVLTWVDRNGRIGLKEVLTASRKQPFMNHAAEGALQYARPVAVPPTSLFAPTADKVYIPLDVSVSGPPWTLMLSVPKL